MTKAKELANITMPDPHGFQVRLVRMGVEYSRYFSIKVWGGKKKALEAAQNWRDLKRASLPKHKPYLNDTPANKTTGVNGISKIVHLDRRRGTKTLRYQVSYLNQERKPTVRTFQVGRIESVTADDDLHAFRTAVMFRKEYEFARAVEADFHPERFKDWKQERLYT